ncbi:MAG: hypothetical protein LBG30_00620, partial [Odoribacteraceae bacterium]|nr:hypothetical protein [Odoribacteraceae bacterium]
MIPSFIFLTFWMLKAHPAFFAQVGRTVSFLTDPDNRDRLGFAASHPNGVWLDNEFLPAYTVYVAAYNRWMDPSQRTGIIIADLDDAEEALRHLYKILRNLLTDAPYVTDGELLGMNLPPRTDDERHPSPVARVYPVIAVISGMIRHLRFTFFTLDSTNTPRKRKPDGQHGVELCWVISASPVANLDDLLHSTFSTTTELDLSFPGDDRGKTVYFAARWHNTRGIPGPWSPIDSAI